MPAGLRITGDNGLYQITEDTFCLVVTQHGHLGDSVRGFEPFWNARLYTITVVADTPLFALYVPPDENNLRHGGIWQTTRAGSSWTVTFAVMGNVEPPDMSIIKWFVLDRPAPVPGAGAGMRVFDGAGRPVYTTQWPTKTLTQSFTPGRKYAGVGGLCRFWNFLQVQTDEGGSPEFSEAWYMDGFRCPDGSVLAGTATMLIQHGDGNGSGQNWTPSGASSPLFGVDVTEYF